jgi:hypothetical protein
MGYTLTIGNAKLNYSEDYCGVDADPIASADGPFQESQYSPPYTSWHNSMQRLGLMDVMFNERNGGNGFTYAGKTRAPLIDRHPGVMPISKEHVMAVEEILSAYKAAHPEHRPEFPPPKPGAVPVIPGSSIYAVGDYSDDPRYDSALARGEWLAWWLRYALEHCERPVFVNT